VQLDEVVLPTLEREPELRYQHASEVEDGRRGDRGGQTLATTGGTNRERCPARWSHRMVVGFGGPTLARSRPAGPYVLFARSETGGEHLVARIEAAPTPYQAWAVLMGAWNLAGVGIGCATRLAAIGAFERKWPALRGWVLAHRSVVHAAVRGQRRRARRRIYLHSRAFGRAPARTMVVGGVLALAWGLVVDRAVRPQAAQELDNARRRARSQSSLESSAAAERVHGPNPPPGGRSFLSPRLAVVMERA
jgi:hypothetical protein